MNQTDLIKEFINGATSGEVGNAKIQGDQFIHFSTPMIERYKDKYIVNISRYTDVTRFLQRKINSIIPENKKITVEKVTWDYAGKLADYLK